MKNGRKRSRKSRKRSENLMCWHLMYCLVNMPTKSDFSLKSSDEIFFLLVYLLVV